jgi:hypothetical protein
MRSHLPPCMGLSLFSGIMFLVIGSVFLLANLGWTLPAVIKVWWPVVPMVLGALSLLRYAWRGPRGGRPYRDFA